MCNHPDLFEARQIDSPLVLPPLELRVGTRVLRSPLRFPTGFGGVGLEPGRGGGAGTAARCIGVDVSENGGGGGAAAMGGGGDGELMIGRGVSRSLVAPLWAHDLSG